MKFYKLDNDSGRLCRSFKDDCVIRSISVALRLPYKQVFEELMLLGLELGAYPNHETVWVMYVESKGMVKHKPPRDANGKMIKLANWDYNGRAVVKSSGHLTAVDSGELVDSWDCRYRPVNSYWELEVTR